MSTKTMKNTVDFPNSISQKPLHRNPQTKIVTLYGGDTWKEIRDLEKTRVKIQRKEVDLLSLTFLLSVYQS